MVNKIAAELNQADIFRLVDVMKMCDDKLSYLFSYMSDACFRPEDFALVKGAVIFWCRVYEQFGIPYGSAMKFIPKLYPEDFVNDAGVERGACDDICDYIFSGYEIALPELSFLEGAGITASWSQLKPDTITAFKEQVEHDARESEEVLDREAVNTRVFEILKQQVFPLFCDDSTNHISSFIHDIEKTEFCAENIMSLRSKRVGRFMSNKNALQLVLPKRMVDAVSFLVDAVFDPIYVQDDDLKYVWLNEAGEYCGLYCMGYSELYVENCIYSAYMRPYADIAIVLLDRLLADAESLAPDILGDIKVSADAA